jgi:hypothetical protein
MCQRPRSGLGFGRFALSVRRRRRREMVAKVVRKALPQITDQVDHLN